MALRINDRRQWLMIAAVGVVAIFVLDRIILSPMVRAWQDRSERIAVLRESIERGQSLLDRADMLESRWQQMTERAISTDISVAENDLLKSVARWARESGITFTSMIPQWKKSEAGYQTLVCRATANGDLEKAARFLYELERDELAVRLEQCEMAARDSRGQLIRLTLRLSGLQLTPEEEQL